MKKNGKEANLKKALVNDEKLQQRLREEQFDIAISEGYYVCGLGIFEVLGIKTTLVAVSNPHLDSVAYALGEPSLPSYVPGIMSTTGDKMTFAERFQNIFALLVGRMVTGYLNNNEVEDRGTA
ncbi:hypothetical protein OESDEN_02586 [Oesophagostomum dentatum]|uniref:glucuronosyltransferase n=1 Tax=Oesophagostomum dentatum TaxID=61180 RepID=A0A0B1TNK8_OESDE|nr:hypothetical protein OESDEN_02586 [Oesophagostomum dentatum]